MYGAGPTSGLTGDSSRQTIYLTNIPGQSSRTVWLGSGIKTYAYTYAQLRAHTCTHMRWWLPQEGSNLGILTKGDRSKQTLDSDLHSILQRLGDCGRVASSP